MKSVIHAICLLCLLLPVVGLAGEVGFKVGLLDDGELETSEPMPYRSRGTTGSYAIGVFADQTITENFFVGLHFDAFKLTDNYTDIDTTLYQIGVHLKSAISLGSVNLRPGFGVGYGEMEILDETSTHLLLQGFIELSFYDVLDTGNILTEVGFIASPDGGISGVTDITFSPMFFYRLGISF